jgi:soluble lytic murein transglycosylase
MNIWARWEYKDFLDMVSDELAKSTAAIYMIEELALSGMTDEAFSLSQKVFDNYKARSNNVPYSVWRLVYPVYYGEYVFGYAQKSGLDPYFALAVMRQESMFNPTATSIADARGLMQIIPETGEKISLELSEKDFKPEYLYDPEVSVRFGVHHLSDLIRRQKGTYYALAGYNAGESQLKRWKDERQGRDDDMLLFTELIDYVETRRYVRKCMENYLRYRELWTNF